MSEIALRFEHVRKDFRHFPSPLQRLQEIFWPFGGKRHTPVPVLEDLDFSIARGESVAIIGPNGVGKSTMLHLVAGLLEPSAGRIVVNGTVAALLEIGGGFLHELTGRENARFYHRLVTRGSDDPLARERYVEEFAQLGEFFDRPVRTYSSGMFLRLAFACATAEHPDIILIDEVLAVGDAKFQQKCYQRLAEMRARGTTVVLVTHIMHALTTICDRVLVLDHGRIVFDGEPGRGIDRYYQLFFTTSEEGAANDALRYGQGGATISHIEAFSSDGQRTNAFNGGEIVRITFDVEFQRDVQAPAYGFSCSTKEGTSIYSTTSTMLGIVPAPAFAGERRQVEITFRLDVGVGDVFVNLSVFEVVSGAVHVYDTHVNVLHLTVRIPSHYIGVADVSAAMRVMT